MNTDGSATIPPVVWYIGQQHEENENLVKLYWLSSYPVGSNRFHGSSGYFSFVVVLPPVARASIMSNRAHRTVLCVAPNIIVLTYGLPFFIKFFYFHVEVRCPVFFIIVCSKANAAEKIHRELPLFNYCTGTVPSFKFLLLLAF